MTEEVTGLAIVLIVQTWRHAATTSVNGTTLRCSV